MKPLAFALLAVAVAPLALAACGNEEVATSSPAPPKPPAPVASASASAKAGPEYAESDFVENDRNRDPFRTFIHLFTDTGTKPAPVQRHVLCSQYSLDELKLVALVQGAEYPRALFIQPNGRAQVLKRGDFVGRAETVHTGGTNGTDYQLNWRVDRVRDADVVFTRDDPARPNIPPATRVVPLHPESENKGANEDLSLGDGTQ